MTFTWPLALLLGLTVPLVLAVYLLAMRRRRQAVTYSSLALVRSALPGRSRWYRHLPIALLLASLALLAVAAARPQISREVPVGKTSIILALDESGSMCSTDVKPNRLAAAQKAARSFVDAQPDGVRVGLVLFSGFAEVAVAPTTDRDSLNKALDSLTTSNSTAIGAAILKSLDAIAEVDPKVRPVGNAAANVGTDDIGRSGDVGRTGGTGAATPKPGAGGYVPDVIVLLTDGSNTQGISPLEAVPYAVARGVRIYTIGLGTSHPAPLLCTAGQLGGIGGDRFGRFGPGGFGFGFGAGGAGAFAGGPGGRSPLVADLPTLKDVARRTGGAAYTARTANQLDKVFTSLPHEIKIQREEQEITAIVAALGGLVALAALGAAIRWSPSP